MIQSSGSQPWKITLLPFIQIPLFITMSLTLREMCGKSLSLNFLSTNDTELALGTHDSTQLSPTLSSLNSEPRLEEKLFLGPSDSNEDLNITRSIDPSWGPLPGMESEGFFLFPNLLVVDPTWVVPCLIGIGHFWNVQLGFTGTTQLSRGQIILKRVLLSLTSVLFLSSAAMPMVRLDSTLSSLELSLSISFIFS